jgi:hypothetical protein
MFITELKDELIALGNEITELKDKFYYLEAPIDVIEPYAVLSSTGNEHIQDTGNEFEDIYFQVNVYSKDADEVNELSLKIIREYKNSEAIINAKLTDYHIDEIRRRKIFSRKFEGVFINTIDFYIDLTKL